MSGIGFTISEEKIKLPIGASKVFGNPDVWDGFEWPQFTESEESYDLSFVCQIGCADAATFGKDDLLPKSGMLYFFYDMDEMPKESISPKASRVLYYDGDVIYCKRGKWKNPKNTGGQHVCGTDGQTPISTKGVAYDKKEIKLSKGRLCR